MPFLEVCIVQRLENGIRILDLVQCPTGRCRRVCCCFDASPRTDRSVPKGQARSFVILGGIDSLAHACFESCVINFEIAESDLKYLEALAIKPRC
jgi:hypothetical protein